jgi:hypothetical protein
MGHIMTNPATITCNAGVWTPVAVNVRFGTVQILDKTHGYLWTQRDTGGSAPTYSGTGAPPEGRIFEGTSMKIESPRVSIDVYIWPLDPSGGSVGVIL